MWRSLPTRGADELRDRLFELFDRERLSEHRVRARARGREVGGAGDDGDRDPALEQLVEQLLAPLDSDVHVEQDDVDAPVEVLTRLVERPRLTNLVPVQLEIHL